MDKELFKTKDGSYTLFIPEWNESYHSKHGAIQEAYHVFIQSGFNDFKKNKSLKILEIGLGTGLNCFITFLENNQLDSPLQIDYFGMEKFPIDSSLALKMDYPKELNKEEHQPIFKEIHTSDWNKKVEITTQFSLTKLKEDLLEIKNLNLPEFDLIYFDAFGFRVQPELWQEEVFENLYKLTKQNGVLVTYAAKGSVKRALIAAGYRTEKLPGPPGKREMLKGTKNLNSPTLQNT